MANVKAERREDRLKAALRENLKRRKAQARDRQGVDRRADQKADPEASGLENRAPGDPKERLE